jgi:hypothetical protein
MQDTAAPWSGCNRGFAKISCAKNHDGEYRQAALRAEKKIFFGQL